MDPEIEAQAGDQGDFSNIKMRIILFKNKKVQYKIIFLNTKVLDIQRG